ncbi:MAG: exopolysaccharide Pel transporter PelG [Chloroflexi bacterium]|nr:exopolysaccharide Pel transporter PelG [Chloroflexota bacterium]
MAGIGFRLQKLIGEDSYLGAVKAYVYSAVISSGPWISSIAALAVLGVLSARFLPQEDRDIFFATLVYAFALSLVTTSVVQMAVTRYLADQLYLDNKKVLLPTLVGVMLAVYAGEMALLLPFYALAPFPLFFKLSAGALYLAISGIWVSMIFLSAARDYLSIVVAFVVGYLVSFGAALPLGVEYGLLGQMAGFTAGQMFTFCVLVSRVFAEFDSDALTPSPRRGWGVSFAGFSYLRRYPSLVAIAVLFNVGIWADKALFWFAPDGLLVGRIYRLFPPYDSAMLLSYLTVVPAMTVFLVDLETSFYHPYRAFYDAIAEKKTLSEIQAAKARMVDVLKANLGRLVKVQAYVAAMTLLFSQPLFALLTLPESQLHIFRLGVLANGVQAFALVLMLLLLYLDMRGSVVIVAAVFLVGNTLGTLATLQLGWAFYGAGYLAGALVAALIALAALDNRLTHLERLTFMRQPMAATEER